MKHGITLYRREQSYKITLITLYKSPRGWLGLWCSREMMHGRRRLRCGFGARLRLLSKLRMLGPIKPLVNFHTCIISCAVECPEYIYFIQNSDKHNQLLQQLSWPFTDSQTFSFLSGHRTDVPAEPPSHSS